MRELSMMEIEYVSGAGFIDSVGAAVLGGAVGFITGAFKGGVSGGSAGGILGIGAISAAVTMGIGMIGGTFAGALFGMINGWDTSVKTFNEWCMQMANMALPPPRV